MLQGLSAEEQRALLLSVGTHRGERYASPTEVARIMRKARDAGATPDEIAGTCHLRSTSMIPRFLRLLDLPEDIHDWIDWQSSPAQLSMTAAQEIGRLSSHEQMRELARLALENRLVGKEVGQAVMRTQRAGESVSDAVAAILKLRPRVERVYVFIGTVTSDATRRRLAELSKRERGHILARALDRVGVVGLSGSLGPDRFTLVANSEVGPKHTANALEAIVNPALDEVARDE